MILGRFWPEFKEKGFPDARAYENASGKPDLSERCPYTFAIRIPTTRNMLMMSL